MAVNAGLFLRKWQGDLRQQKPFSIGERWEYYEHKIWATREIQISKENNTFIYNQEEPVEIFDIHNGKNDFGKFDTRMTKKVKGTEKHRKI